MKKVFKILNKDIQGLSAEEAKTLMPGKIVKETDPDNFKALFEKVAVAASLGKAGLRLNSQQQKMCSHFKDELRNLGYQIVETDLKWAPGDNIEYEKNINAADAHKISLDITPKPVVQSTLKPSNDKKSDQEAEKKGFFGRMVDKVKRDDDE